MRADFSDNVLVPPQLGGDVPSIGGPAGAGGGLMGPVGVAVGAGAEITSAIMQKEAADQANQTNIQLTREQMRFQERMSNSAHQREVRDLALAGLNPLLSANAGASSPSGASPTVNPAVADVGRAIGNAMSKAMDFFAFRKEMQKKDAEIVATQASAEAARAQAENSRANAANTKSVAKAVKAQADVDEARSKFDKKAVLYDSISSRVSPLLNSIMNVFSGVSSAGAAKRAGDLRESELLNRAGSKGVRQP